jgi:hypothetical protein
MLYFLVTTCIFNDSEIRKNQYFEGIKNLVILLKKFDNYKIIIIENNGERHTYLNDLIQLLNSDKIENKIFYTNNNFIKTNNKGIKELKDIKDCIEYFKINNNDFIVKITGRYILTNNSEFINNLNDIQNIDCLIKYGSYLNPDNNNTNDCITGLIGMRCIFVKLIEEPNENECVEWKWAKVTHKIESSKIKKVNNLGIYICPGNNNYFLV